MALDGAFLHMIQGELDCLLEGRIDKVYQPSRESVILGFRTKQGARKLLISAAPSSARVHMTQVAVDNPAKPPMFCMLLRKHLTGGRLIAIRQDGLERILFLDFQCTNELGDSVVITLACEIMGRCSNLVVIRQDGTILDCLRRVDASVSRERMVLPGMTYAMPPREERLCLLDADRDALTRLVTPMQPGKLAKQLVAGMEGISPLLAREWAYYAFRGSEPVGDRIEPEQADRLVFAMQQTRSILLGEQPAHYATLRTREGMLKEFCFQRIAQYGTLMLESEASSACETLDEFYARRDQDARLKQRANDLFTLLMHTMERISKRLANQREELAACAAKEDMKQKGDLLSANLYQLQKGDAVARVQIFYDPACPTVEIPLDVRLTPSQNAQRYYAKYRKASTAEKVLVEQIRNGEEELRYIDSVFDALTRCTSETDIAVLREELAGEGYLRAARRGTKPTRSQPPLVFRSSDGFQILVGRNNRQNDQLTLKQAAKQDLWLHTQGIPGSHVIVVSQGREIPESTIYEAALLAAHHSKGRDSAQVPVDYCPVRYVKKPNGAKPGMVIFTNYRTLYVKPDEEILERCREGVHETAG